MVNEKITKITSKCERMLHVQKKIIKKSAKDKNHQKVTDHSHYTGKYRGVTYYL